MNEAAKKGKAIETIPKSTNTCSDHESENVEALSQCSFDASDETTNDRSSSEDHSKHATLNVPSSRRVSKSASFQRRYSSTSPLPLFTQDINVHQDYGNADPWIKPRKDSLEMRPRKSSRSKSFSRKSSAHLFPPEAYDDSPQISEFTNAETHPVGDVRPFDAKSPEESKKSCCSATTRVSPSVGAEVYSEEPVGPPGLRRRSHATRLCRQILATILMFPVSCCSSKSNIA